MQIKTELHGDLRIYCAVDKSYCWAKTVSTRQVEALHEYAKSEGYKKYFGETPSGNHYGVENGEVRILSKDCAYAVKGTYQDGDIEREGFFCSIPVEPELETQPEPIEQTQVSATPDVPNANAAPAEQVSNSVTETEPVTQAVAAPTADVPVASADTTDYKSLYNELVDRYNELANNYNEAASALATIQQAFRIIKQLTE